MARHASPLNSTATRALIALATASAALGAGAATASADSAAALKVPVSPAAISKIAAAPQAAPVKGIGGDLAILRGAGGPHGNGVDIPLSGVTGPITQTGPIGAVPALEGFAGLLGAGGLS
ncbi:MULTISPECIES: hypothetical protein [unclassified Streptomyces]|uniref:hypothetical protein n=1 Tax=unclassified Streptomyces TaxID=2593676 RepID=UPI002255E67B|nr:MULTISPECIES: hypothetical protein [unclassified Streptomyces]MCX4883214.1 hypothetical protein [Streptomyces sp. NBC_00847]MCX5423238.1 hypothetical protein [Streptomyces sp. NBC_00078]